MHKRVLVVEAADAVRGVAENVLRQNGYEVISVTSADKASEVLQFSQPDLLLISADVTTSNYRPFYEKIQGNPKTASIPILIIAGSENTDIPFPDEVVIPRPFDPQELISKVRIFAGQAQEAPAKPKPTNPLGESDLDDDFLDAALGIDSSGSISVTDSEVMNQTTVPRRETEDSSKVESLMIQDEEAEIAHNDEKTVPPSRQSGTSKLEIMDDQYGLSDPQAFKNDQAEVEPDHDYNWFINSMKDEAEQEQNKPAETSGTKSSGKAQQDSGKLAFTDPAAQVDPVTPPPKSSSKAPSKSATPPKVSQAPTKMTGSGKVHVAGVEKFIDEFKKEVEQIQSEEPETMVVVDEDQAQASQAKMVWEEKLEKISPQEIQLFTRQFTTELAERLAAKIAEKIDPNKLAQVIKNELINYLKNKK